MAGLTFLIGMGFYNFTLMTVTCWPSYLHLEAALEVDLDFDLKWGSQPISEPLLILLSYQ